MKKIICKIIIACFITQILFPFYVFAYSDGVSLFGVSDKFAHVWDGTSDTSFEGGTGTEGDPYQIATPEQLAYLRDTVNAGESYEGKYFILTQDLKMNKDEFFVRNEDGIVTGPAANIDIHNAYGWHGIGTGTFRYFSGVFDGQGHTINNLYGSPGLFYSIKNATLRNITVDGYVDDSLDGGSNVLSVGGLLATLNMYDDSSIIENCINKCYCKGDTVGGITGCASGGSDQIINNNIIKNCINYGIIEGYSYAGGIVGLNEAEPFEYGSSYNIDIINCGNYGDVTSTIDNRGKGSLDLDMNSHAGGIVGQNKASYSDFHINTTTECNIKNCYNYGNITLLGYGDENYINYGYVNLSVGGIVGTNCAYAETSNSKATATIDSCYNAGIVKGYSANSENIQIGGIVGYNHSDSSWYVRGGGDDATGSFFHDSDTDADMNRYSKAIVKNCFNVGLVEDTTTFEITRDLLAPVTAGNTEDGQAHGYLIGNCCGGIVGKNLTETYAASAYAEIYNNYNRAMILDKGQTNSGNVLGKTVSYKRGITRCIENNENFTIRNELAENKIENLYYLNNGVKDEYSAGLSNSAMKRQSSFGEFDFNDIWTLNKSSDYPYPILKQVPFNGVVSDGLDEMPKGTFDITNSTSEDAPIVTSAKLTYTGKTYDIFSQAVTIEEDSDITATIEATADNNGCKNVKVYIMQSVDKKINITGACKDLKPGKDFTANKDIYILAVDEDTGKSTSKKTKLKISSMASASIGIDGGPDGFNFKLGKDVGFTLPDSVPVFGGTEVKWSFDFIPVTVGYDKEDDNKINVVIGGNLVTEEYEKNGVKRTYLKDFDFKKYKKDLSHAARTQKHSLKDLRKFFDNDKGKKKNMNFFKGMVSGSGKGKHKNNVDVMGYAEMKYIDGQWQFVEGVFTVDVEIKFTYEGQAFVWVVPVYYEIGGGVGAGFEGKMIDINPKSFTPQFEGYLTAKAMGNIGGGIGFSGVGTVGASGDASFNIKTSLMEEYAKVWGEGSAKIVIKVFGKTVADPDFLSGDFLVYETGNKKGLIKSNGVSLKSVDGIYNIDANQVYENENRAYIENPTEWVGNEPQINLMSADYTNKDLKLLAENIYTESAPQICEVDGKKVMVMQWDNASRADADRTMLVYSVYDESGKTWSAPVAVEDDGTADFYPCFKDSYLVWQNEKATLTDDMTLTDIAKLGEICVSKWNGNGFDEPVQITDNNTLDTQPQIASNGVGASVVWTTNTENDIIGITGKNAIMQSDFDGTNWSSPTEIKSNLNAVTNITAGKVNNDFCVAYVSDDDNDLNTIDDRDIRIIRNGTETQLTDNDVLDSNPVFVNNMIYYYSESNIAYSGIDGTNKQTVFGEAMPGLTDSFAVDGNDNGDTAIWWTKAIEGGAEVYSSLYKDNEWSDEIQVTSIGNKAKYPSGIINNDGSMVVAFNNGILENNEIVKTDLYTISVNPSYDLEVTDAYFDEDSMTAYATVKNNGELAVDSYTVALNDSGVNASQTITEPLKAGESAEIDITYNKPENLTKSDINLSVAMTDGEENNTENNTAVFSIGNADIAVENIAIDEEETTITADVSNIGYDDAQNVKIQLRDGSVDGAVIEEKTVNLAVSAKESVEFTIDKSTMRFFDATKQLYVTASGDFDEVSMGNNDGYVLINSPSGAADYETEILSYNQIDGKYMINSIARNNTDKSVSCIMYSAVYSSDGILKACGMVTADIDANNDTGVDIAVPCTIETGDTVKTFMWTDKMEPLAKMGEWQNAN